MYSNLLLATVVGRQRFGNEQNVSAVATGSSHHSEHSVAERDKKLISRKSCLNLEKSSSFCTPEGQTQSTTTEAAQRFFVF